VVGEKFGTSPVRIRAEWTWWDLWLAWVWLEDVEVEVEAQMEKVDGGRWPVAGERGKGERRREMVVKWSEMDRVLGLTARKWPMKITN